MTSRCALQTMSGPPSGMVRRGCLLALILVLGLGMAPSSVRTVGQPADESTTPKTPAREGRARDFAPGVRIDWADRAVEVEARVVLREGPLELLACTPGTREHESILVVRGRPTHIYQAMGLVGLNSGSPVRYDEKEQRLIPPAGQPLDLSIRYDLGGAARTVPAERWLWDVKRRTTPESVPWVFAGSRLLRDGQLGAEADGTVACVVDFSTALIAIGALHTADNEALWLAANAKEIPAVGAPCTLVIRGKSSQDIRVRLTADGTMRLRDKPVSAAELAKLMQPRLATAEKARIILLATPEVSDETVESVVTSLVQAGIPRETVDPRQPQKPSRPPD
jgi:hypothetical protein